MLSWPNFPLGTTINFTVNVFILPKNYYIIRKRRGCWFLWNVGYWLVVLVTLLEAVLFESQFLTKKEAIKTHVAMQKYRD